jgi:hypothetical protein
MADLELAHPCAGCGAAVRASLPAPGDRIACDACGRGAALSGTDALIRERVVNLCAVCGGYAFYRQRDLNRKLGLGIIIAAAILAVPTHYVSLAVAVVLDLALWFLLPEVTVCYACGTLYRGFRRHPEHRGFDLALFEHHRRKAPAAPAAAVPPPRG